MKIGWGTRIAALYIGFIILMIGMVYVSMCQKVELVSDDYYKKELAFQSQINSTKNADSLSQRILHQNTPAGIALQFPPEFISKNVSGTITMFRPSDATKDIDTPVKLNDKAQQIISYTGLISGMYRMKINWQEGSKSYYSEDTLHILR